VYLLGGYSGGGYVSTVYTAPINSDGSLGTWTTGTSLPGALGNSQAIVTKNRVYLLGGYSGGYVSTVYTAPINSDGSLGAWTTGTSLPGALAWSQTIVTKNRVYLLGGDNGTYSSTVYTATISGGLNDYSPYYDGSITPTDPNNFHLPDTTTTDTNGLYTFIKY
jgi:N-acetylneuraminic acid mutarotase